MMFHFFNKCFASFSSWKLQSIKKKLFHPLFVFSFCDSFALIFFCLFFLFWNFLQLCSETFLLSNDKRNNSNTFVIYNLFIFETIAKSVYFVINFPNKLFCKVSWGLKLNRSVKSLLINKNCKISFIIKIDISTVEEVLERDFVWN